jgi:hypothetical protein
MRDVLMIAWTGLGNPEGGLVFTNAFGNYQQTHEWTSFMSSSMSHSPSLRGLKLMNRRLLYQGLCGWT